jgi:hypothetical protein
VFVFMSAFLFEDIPIIHYIAHRMYLLWQCSEPPNSKFDGAHFCALMEQRIKILVAVTSCTLAK